MLYHPDKHRDPELKSQAEQLFNQVHQAYEGQDASRYVKWNINQFASAKNMFEIWLFSEDMNVNMMSVLSLSAEWWSH